MRITHLNNSFIALESCGEVLACDPWVGKANASGWQSFPEFSTDALRAEFAPVRWVYISHLHDDHFHPETLEACALMDREFIIKRYEAPMLRERLKRLGIERIHEVESFSLERFGPFELAIFPQMTSNSSGLDDDVNYDLDTSLAVKADGAVFFNQVDNPLSLADLGRIHAWISQHMGPVDAACLMSGAASEYPHLFLNIDKQAEKDRIVRRSLDDLVEWLRVLSPRCYFPAGGTYLIPGPLGAFNHLIAQPDFAQILATVKTSGLAVQALDLEGGRFVRLDAGGIQEQGDGLAPLHRQKEVAIESHRVDPYFYESLITPDFDALVGLLQAAQGNWERKVELDRLTVTQSLRFEIYRQLRTTASGRPDSGERLGGFELSRASDPAQGELVIHIDHRALFGCLTRQFIWNGVLGTLCMYERTPNRHHPTDLFSLNHLALTREQLAALGS